MIDLHIAFEFILAALAAVIGLSTGYLLTNIREDSQQVMTQFKLAADHTSQDFKILLTGEATILFIFALYPVAGVLGNTAFINAARILLLVFLAEVAYVFARQWRRSR
jgi:AraC-like DNA-binding protein